MILAATAYRNIGYVIAVVAIAGFLVYAWFNFRKGKAEIGSEVELASNRKPYLDDEQLETRKLDATLSIGLVTLAVVAVALPVYWLAEPGRQQGAVDLNNEVAISRGEEIYTGFCAGCHAAEGVGGVTAYTLTTPEGDFIDNVEWKVPALDTVLMRYSKEEVRFVLNYGRANTPMPAWGEPGGGAMTTQMIDNVIEYLESIQLPEDEVRSQVSEGLVTAYVEKAVEQEVDARVAALGGDLGEEELTALQEAVAEELTEEATAEVESRLEDNEYDYDLDGVWSIAELGQAMFNLEAANGTYSCARCHTKGWSYGEPETSGGGFLGPNLTGGSTTRQFPSFDQHVAFITEGGQSGQAYGQGGVSGAGQMPGFGYNPNAEEEDSDLTPEQFLYTAAQIEAVVEYERGL